MNKSHLKFLTLFFCLVSISLAVMAVAPFKASGPEVGSPQVQTAPKIEYLTSPERARAPFSEAVRVGNLLFLSGQLGRDPKTGKLAEGGIEAETRQCLENIKNTLEKYGSSMDKVIKATVMLADITEWAKMNSVYVTYFPKNKPARSAFGVSGLAGGARVEIEVIALIE
ncbi:MAG: RidA family protein [Candidatus Aminicenantes bacterium]|nr:RidA family protein [Candidatus Aminicenantes bacterium]